MNKLSLILFFTFALIAFSSINVNAQQKVTFKRGSDTARVDGSLPANGSKTFVVYAKQGQMMRAELTSPNNVVKFKGEEGATIAIWQVETVKGNNSFVIRNISKKPAKFILFVAVK